jgi:hypothetical protein
MTEAINRLPHPQQRATTPHTSARGMQRRHFELIAEIISKELHGEYREKAAYAFAYILPITNANFDSQRFLKACKVNAFTDGDNQ